MLMNRRILLVACAAVLSCSAGCNKYDKLLKSTDTERQWHAALDYYQRGKWNKAAQLFERVAPLSRATKRADSAYYYLSDSQFHNGDYDLAGYGFEQYIANYPRSLFLQEASFMAPYCHYLNSPRPELDQQPTIKAINGFNEYIAGFPLGAHRAEADRMLKEMYNKLMTKSYLAAKEYYHQEYYRSAIVALRGSLEKYPDSPYREEGQFLILRSTYLMAKNSVPEKRRERYQQTVDEYLTFAAEFGQSRYIKEASDYYVKSMRFLGKDPNPELVK